MRLKVYHAPNMGAAMAMVRTELGPDALILATRAADGGIEVTAALEPTPLPVQPLIDPARQVALRWHGVPEHLQAALGVGDMKRAVEATFHFHTLSLETSCPPLLCVGQPGAGKTLTVARLATRLVLAGQRPLVITADGKRAGAAEQLAAFTRLLGLTLIAADEPVTLARALARRQEGAPVLIDTPGLDPTDPADREWLGLLLGSTSGEAALVLPAGVDPAEAGEIGDAYRAAGVRMMIATRLDQSRRLGGIVAAAAAGLSLTEAGLSPNPVDGLHAFTPELLIERLAYHPGASARSSANAAPALPDENRKLPPYIRPREAQPKWPS